MLIWELHSRPSPRDLSQAFMKGVDGLGSLRNRTALQTFFGQVGYFYSYFKERLFKETLKRR